MNREEIEAYCEERDITLLLADGFDEAFIGIVQRFGMEDPIALYDRDKCIEILMERDGMTWEGAEEFFGFNVIGAWVGDETPAFATLANGVNRPCPRCEARDERARKMTETATRLAVQVEDRIARGVCKNPDDCRDVGECVYGCEGGD